MADSTVTIGGDISDLQQKLKQAGAGIQSFGDKARKDVGGIDFGKAFAFAGGIAGLTSLVKIGFDFNQTMKDGEVAIGNVLKTFKGLSDEAAKQEAARAVQLIADIEPQAAGGLQELTQGFIASAAAAASAGLSVEQNVDLVARFANALSNSQQPMDQLNQEIRSVLTANVTSDSFVGKLLEGKGLNNERIKQLAQEGTLYQELVSNLGALGEAGDTAGVAFSTLESAARKTLGAFTEGLFEKGVEGAKDLANWLEANKTLFQDIGTVIGRTAEQIGSFASFVKDATQAFGEMAGDNIGRMMGFGDGGEAQGITDALDRFVELRKEKEKLTQDTPAPAASGQGIPPSVSPAAAKSASTLLGLQREIEQVEKMREQIGNRQFATLLKNLTPALQIEAIEKRISQEKARQVALEAGAAMARTSLTEAQQLETADRLLRLQEDLAQAKQRQAQAAAEAADKERKAAEENARLTQASMDLEKEMQALRAEASGDTDRADALRREMAIEAEKRQIMQDTGMAEADALRLAKERQQLNEKLANAGKDDGGKISARISGGVAEARQRAQDRIQGARQRSEDAVTSSFGTFESEQARLKDSFAAAFGGGTTAATPQNPAQVQAAKNEAATRPQTPGGETQQGLELIRNILETLKG